MGNFYPVSLNLKDKKCLVVGGGRVAERKVASLLACEAIVYVVSPLLTPLLNQLFCDGKIFYLNRDFCQQDLKDCLLVICATNDSIINQSVAQQAMQQNILVNVVDKPELCNFFVPAVLQRGDLTISVSTAGKSPLLARLIRENLDKTFSDAYAEILDMLGEMRKNILASVSDEEARRKIFSKMVNAEIINLLAEGKIEVVKGRIVDVFNSSRAES